MNLKIILDSTDKLIDIDGLSRSEALKIGMSLITEKKKISFQEIEFIEKKIKEDGLVLAFDNYFGRGNKSFKESLINYEKNNVLEYVIIVNDDYC